MLYTVEEIIGQYKFEHITCDIRFMYETANKTIDVFSNIHGSLMRFRAIGPLNLMLYNLKKTVKGNIKLDIKEDKHIEFHDYIYWLIQGFGGKIIHLKYIKFQELRDRILADKI
jgi:hypothetical protein